MAGSIDAGGLDKWEMAVERMRVGIVGMGQRTCHQGHGAIMFADCPEEAHVAAVCDNSPERLACGNLPHQG